MGVNEDIAGLLALVACPSCQSCLAQEPGRLRCSGCGRNFPVDRGVPIFDDSERALEDQSVLGRLHYALLGDPRVYEFHHAYGGGRPVAAQVKRHLSGVTGATVVDVGAGTGVVGGLLSPGTRYVWLDNDRLKLRGLLSKRMTCFAVLGDAARLPFASKAADWTVMVEVSHHLPEGPLHEALDEAARITRDRFLFVDAVRGPRLRSRLLWQLDLGRFPRTDDELIRALEASFDLEKVEHFRVHHEYLLCICAPKRLSGVASA
jgi:SAM-dependent methyltransferase